MSDRTVIRDAKIVNEGKILRGSVIIEGERILAVEPGMVEAGEKDRVIEADGSFLLPGVIDDQVHFREPGMTEKEDIRHGSRAALAGGVTSFMEMPNTKPPTTDFERLEEKFRIAEEQAAVNHSFYFGATKDNLHLLERLPETKACGVKIFLGSSTGELLFTDRQALRELFERSPLPIAAHCEEESVIAHNIKRYRKAYGEELSMRFHPIIRSHEACYRSSSRAVRLAHETGAPFQVLHISTGRETELFHKGELKDKKVTSEACIHHLYFTEEDYEEKGTRIKWNPAVKSEEDRDRILEAVNDDRIDLIATDHAPHTEEEKKRNYFDAPSGAPLIQHGLLLMFELYRKRRISLQQVVKKMCHAPAERFGIKERGFIRKGYYADLLLLHPNRARTVKRENIHYKCGWSPLEGEKLHGRVTHCFVNGTLAYRDDERNGEEFLNTDKGTALEFNDR